MTHVMWFLAAGGIAILCCLASTHVGAAPAVSSQGAVCSVSANGTAIHGGMPLANSSGHGVGFPGVARGSGHRNSTAPGRGVGAAINGTLPDLPNGTHPSPPNDTYLNRTPSGAPPNCTAFHGTHRSPPNGTYLNRTPPGAPPNCMAFNGTHRAAPNGTRLSGNRPGFHANATASNGTPPDLPWPVSMAGGI